MAAKVKKVKWALGGDEPADLQEFKDNEQIVKENKGLPTKGVYKFAAKRLFVKPNKNDDDRISVMLVMAEPKDSDNASYNGYVVRDGFNITEQGAPFLKRFLKALGLTWKDFIERSKEQEDGDKRELIQMGKVKFGTAANDDPVVSVLIKEKPADDYNDEPYMDVVRYIPSEDATDEDASGDDVAVDMSEAKPKKKKGKDDALTADSLSKMKPKALATFAAEQGIKAKKIEKAGKDKDALVALVVKELNLPPF